MKNKLGGDIRMIRLEKCLNQEDMAALLGVKQQTYGGWERTGVIPAGRWEQIREIFGVDPAQYVQSGENVNIATGQKSYVGNHMEINKNRLVSDLSPEEQTLINLLRKKDTRGKILERIIADLIMRETEDDRVL